MGMKSFSFLKVFIYILSGGLILFVAVFLGIQAGYAVRGDEGSQLTPDNLPNESLLMPGDPAPALPLQTLDGTVTTLTDVVAHRPTLFGLVLPGCTPCKKLLAQWQQRGITGSHEKFQVVLIATSLKETEDLGLLKDFAEEFPIYWCQSDEMKTSCGISTFPSIMGIKADNTVGFVANGMVYQPDNEFFEKNL